MSGKQTHLNLFFKHEAPPQWEDFCKRHPQERKCTFPGEPMELTGLQVQLVSAVQRHVNHIFWYRKETKDTWDIMGDKKVSGDCEDFALTKRALLHAAGFRLGALWPALVTVTQGSHMVLIVHATDADHILDLGMHTYVIKVGSPQAQKYTWRAIFDGEDWRMVSPTRVKEKEEGT